MISFLFGLNWGVITGIALLTDYSTEVEIVVKNFSSRRSIQPHAQPLFLPAG